MGDISEVLLRLPHPPSGETAWAAQDGKYGLLAQIAAALPLSGTLIEIGTWYGWGLLALTLGATDIVRVVSVDDESAIEHSHELARENLTEGLHLVGDRRTLEHRVFARTDSLRHIGSASLAHIDGLHTRAACLANLCLVRAFTECPYLLVDDVDTIVGVTEAVWDFSRLSRCAFVHIPRAHGFALFDFSAEQDAGDRLRAAGITAQPGGA